VALDSGLAARFRRARCIFFDCDGILFDSNGFKIDAMRQALTGHSELELDAMEAYWRDHGGVSRWVKFRHFFEQIAGLDAPDDALETAVERFGAYSLRAYDDHEPVPEALTVVARATPERAVVVSGASQTELLAVFEKKGFAPRFSEILGSPRTKLDLVRGVLRERGCAGGETLFFGDGAFDFHVATELGVPFVYLDQFTEWTDARGAMRDATAVTWADDWTQIVRALDVPVGSQR
jgi:phosphoglycolate phosphatase-like HAD superfamily hydrolase